MATTPRSLIQDHAPVVQNYRAALCIMFIFPSCGFEWNQVLVMNCSTAQTANRPSRSDLPTDGSFEHFLNTELVTNRSRLILQIAATDCSKLKRESWWFQRSHCIFQLIFGRLRLLLFVKLPSYFFFLANISIYFHLNILLKEEKINSSPHQDIIGLFPLRLFWSTFQCTWAVFPQYWSFVLLANWFSQCPIEVRGQHVGINLIRRLIWRYFNEIEAERKQTAGGSRDFRRHFDGSMFPVYPRVSE